MAQPPQRGPAGRKDLTTGPIGWTLLTFALPTLASNILQSLNGSINSIWVGRFLGEGALAATANANIIMFLMFSAVFGFGMAATILIGQSIGRHDIEAARRAFGSAVGLVMGGAAVIAVVGWVFSPQILRLLATPGEAHAMALAYLRVIFLGLPFSMLGVLIQMSLRGTGDSLTPMWFMALSVAIDSTFNPLLIDGIGPFPKMGIAGSATATLIAGIVSSGGLLLYVYWRDLPIRLRGHEVHYLIPQRALIRTIIAKGLPMGAQMLVMSTAGLTMVGLVNRLGVDTAAAYAVSQQLWTYIQMPAMALGAAVSAMAAQNIGAGRWDRVEKTTGIATLINIAITGALILLIALFDEPILALFLEGGGEAIATGQHMMHLINWSFVLFGIAMVMFGTMRANGIVLAPLIILTLSLFFVRIGFYLVSYSSLGVDGLWLSFPVSTTVTMLLGWAYYRWGRWREVKLHVGFSTAPKTAG